MYLLSALGGGLWIIPLITGLGALYSAYRGYKASKSGSFTIDQYGNRKDSDVNVSYFKTGGGVFSIILAVATIVFIIWMNSEK